MSELIQKTGNASHHADIRWRLLASVSTLALTVGAVLPGSVRAEDADRPTVWIELGGQLSSIEDGQQVFSPAVMDGRPAIFDPSQKFEKLPRIGFDGFGKLSIQPEHSNWSMSASVQFGRATSNKYRLQQTNPKPFEKYEGSFASPVAQKFAQTDAHMAEQHVVLDFQVGKDVGLGMFANSNATSVISVGLRFAQFTSSSNISLKSNPDWHFNYKYETFGYHRLITNGQVFHSNLASMTTDRSFHGMGPSISWQASVPLVENSDTAVIFDWGLNAAVLFGRQKARTHHQTTGRYVDMTGPVLTRYVIPQTTFKGPLTPDHSRSRGVVAPNLGGFAGMSVKYSNAKVSLGYKADFFFGAMDGGIDVRRTEDVGFNGPFATISIGLGG